jgi:hypothetical protein
MGRQHKWTIVVCISVFIVLMYPFLREIYIAWFILPPDRYLSQTRRDELSRFAEEMLRNSQNSVLIVRTRKFWAPGAVEKGDPTSAEMESIRRLLRRHHLDRFAMDKGSSSVLYSHYFIRTWLEYIYVADGGHVPTWPGSPTPRKEAEHWYFAAGG